MLTFNYVPSVFYKIINVTICRPELKNRFYTGFVYDFRYEAIMFAIQVKVSDSSTLMFRSSDLVGAGQQLAAARLYFSITTCSE